MKTTILFTLILISLNSTAQIPSYVPSNGLVGWWPFNGNANDESGNLNNGSVYNATLTQDRNGNPNSAYDFNANAQIVCPQNNIPTQVFSLSVWLNQDNLISGPVVCLGSSESEIWGVWAANNYLAINYGIGCSGTGGGILNTTAIPLANWIHLVYVSSGVGGNTQIYKNGIYAGQAQNSTSTGGCSTQNLYFGVDIFSAPEYIDAKLDDIGIWNRALTEQEIFALYQGCQMSITAQPTNQSVNLSGGNASFYVASNATNPTYQWQTNLGLGFQNLSNAGQYSGVNTAILNVTNISTTNDNQVFRCIINDNGCTETSADATLNIVDDVSVLENGINSILISPNPISNDFSISGIEQIVSLSLKDLSGKLIKTFDVQDKKYSMSNVTSGVYFLEVRDEKQSYIVKVIKE